MDRYTRSHTSVYLPDEVLLLFYDKRAELIACLKAYPSLLNHQADALSDPQENILLQVIDAVDLGHFGEEAEIAFPLADNIQRIRSRQDRQGFALIELGLYVVPLINIYEPNKSILTNIYYSNILVDALGHDNDIPSRRAMQRIVRNSLGFAPPFSHIVDALAAFIKRDTYFDNKKRSLRNGLAFELECETVLVKGGFIVRRTPISGDFGADLIATKDELGYAIQCKDTAKPVGVKAVQEAVSARMHYRTDYAVVCASAGFTDAAIDLASSNKVILCGATQLARRLDAI